MFRRVVGSLFVFGLVIAAPLARATITLNGVTPTNPVAGQPVTASLSYGECDAIIIAPGYPQITRNGNNIRMVLETWHANSVPFCNFTPFTAGFLVGSFPAGDYSLQVDRHYIAFLGNSVIETVGTVPFSVAAAAAVAPIPTIGSTGLFTMTLLMILCAYVALGWRKRSIASLLLIAGITSTMPNGVQAATNQLVEVLVSTDPGAPSAQDIVSYFDPSHVSGGVPLQAFNSVPPNGAAYLLQRRASGDFLAWLNANPQSTRAKLERYVVVSYSESTNLQSALQSLQSDPKVLAAYLPLAVHFDSVTLKEFSVGTSGSQSLTGGYTQYGWDDLNVAAAWQLAGGYALIGDADSGLAVSHAALRQFSGTGQYLGGNFVPTASLDVGAWPNYDGNVDEAEPVPVPIDSPCNPNHLPSVPPAYAGHGTHVAGLIAANSNSAMGLKGTCKNCGIAMLKITKHACLPSGEIGSGVADIVAPVAITLLGDSGVQVVNVSAGGPTNAADICATDPNQPWCLAISYVSYRDTVMVASSGNDRLDIEFPAKDPRVIGAGGFDSNLALWDESPGSFSFCPHPGNNGECGSNYTKTSGTPKQELMGAAKAVLSTTYPGKDWNTLIKCGDNFGPGGGVGLCTGTSMSAPQVAGVSGILRSVNPLVPRSKPVLSFGDVTGIRTVLAQTTVEAQAFQPWTQTFGYGRPDAAAATARMLGKVEGRTVKNRATPLFRLYSSGARDYMETSSPQNAVASILSQTFNYAPPQSALLVPGYAAFPQEPNTTALPAPRANVYVMTTEYKPRPEWPALVPLYLVERKRPFPVGCTGSPPSCYPDNRDFTLLTTSAQLEQAHADGYELRTIQGYVYATCSNEPNCIPPGTQKYYRECKTSEDDCATFLESERSSFEAAGYTTAYPAGSSKVMGYAYPATDTNGNINDTDGDGLVDGFEYVIGTRTDAIDSDGDGASDATEFPMSGVALSDPCSGVGGGNCPSDKIFQNGFQ